MHACVFVFVLSKGQRTCLWDGRLEDEGVSTESDVRAEMLSERGRWRLEGLLSAASVRAVRLEESCW